MRLFLATTLLIFFGVLQALAVDPLPSVYTLSVSVRPKDRYLSVSGSAVIPAQKDAISKFVFQLAGQAKNLQMEIVSPSSAAGPVHPAMVNDNGYGSGNWSADLEKPIAGGEPITLKFSYDAGEKTAFVFHIGPEGSYACGSDIAWYPQFGSASTSGKFSVDGNAQALGTVTYEFPGDMQIVANGRSSEPGLDGQNKTEKFVTEKPSALSFAVDHYRVLKGTGKIPVSLYLKSDLGGDEAFVAGIQRVVDLLTTIYGVFPFPEFSLVELNDKAVAGAGFGGAGCAGFMLSTTSFLNQGFNYAFFGHEIGHQWWGNLVTHATEKEGDDLLDEAMAQYGSLYCVEHILGPASAKRYRTVGFPGYVPTQCGYNYLSMHSAGFDHELENMDASMPLAHELACEKGFLVFDQLRRELGDDTFHRGLKAVTKDYAFRSITLAQFKMEIEQAAHQDLGWFWDQWLKRTGVPSLSVDWKQSGGWVEGVLHQSDPFYRLRVPVAVASSSGSVALVNVNLSGDSATFRIRVDGTATDVKIDPDFTILHYSPDLMDRATAMIPATKVEWGVFSGSAIDGLIDSGLTECTNPDRFGVGFKLHSYKARQLNLQKNYDASARELGLALACPSRIEEMLPACYQLMMNNSNELKDLTRAAWAANAAIECEKALKQHTGISPFG